MKCIKSTKDNKIKRLSDVEAEKFVKTNQWKYVPKNEFKAQFSMPSDEELRKKYPANVEGSPEFNEANKVSRNDHVMKFKRKGVKI